MQEMWIFAMIVLALGIVIGGVAGWVVGQRISSSQLLKELARAQGKIDRMINNRVETGDIWLCGGEGTLRDVYHLRESCGLTGNKRAAPMTKKTVCKGCVKQVISTWQ